MTSRRSDGRESEEFSGVPYRRTAVPPFLFSSHVALLAAPELHPPRLHEPLVRPQRAVLLHLRDTTNIIPHAYFGWTEGNPIAYLLKFLVFGEGDTAPVTREVLRQTEDDPNRRPRVHVG